MRILNFTKPYYKPQFAANLSRCDAPHHATSPTWHIMAPVSPCHTLPVLSPSMHPFTRWLHHPQVVHHRVRALCHGSRRHTLSSAQVMHAAGAAGRVLKSKAKRKKQAEPKGEQPPRPCRLYLRKWHMALLKQVVPASSLRDLFGVPSSDLSNRPTVSDLSKKSRLIKLGHELKNQEEPPTVGQVVSHDL